jgi:hypothetical protein
MALLNSGQDVWGDATVHNKPHVSDIKEITADDPNEAQVRNAEGMLDWFFARVVSELLNNRARSYIEPIPSCEEAM